MSDLLAAAQTYASRNWHVLQVRPRDKAPLLPDWQNLATTDAATVEGWWEEDYNVGVQMGPRSGIIDVECDSPEAEARLAELLGADFPAVPTFQGKRGKHRLFLWSASLPFPERAVFKWEGIEFRTGNGGKGAQSVFPPSSHPDGPAYRWLVEFEDAALVPFPEEALRLVLGAPPAAPAPPGAGVAGMIPEGHRHEVFLSLAGKLREFGLPAETIEPMLAVLNERHCLPPRPAKDVAKLARSMAAYQAGTGLNPPRLLLNGFRNGHAAEGARDLGLILERMSAIRPRPLRWLVRGFLPLGKMVLLAGDGGKGKSALTMHLIGRLTRGQKPFTALAGPGGDPCDVLLVNCEDDPNDTVLPRLMAAGADPERVFWVKGVRDGDNRTDDFRLCHRDALLAELDRHPNIRLVVIDPVSAYVGGTDDHRDADLRGLLGPLCTLAAERSITFLLVKHLSKSTAMRAAHLVSGSVAWVNACRAAFVAAPDPQDPDRRLLMPIKWNLGKEPPSLAFSFQGMEEAEWLPLLQDCDGLSDADKAEVGNLMFRIAWLGEADVDVDDVIASSRLRKGPERGGKVDAAAEWLLAYLKAGPRPSEDIVRDAKMAGFSRDTLFRAKKSLDDLIRARKTTFRGDWEWRINELSEASEESARVLGRTISDASDASDASDGWENSIVAFPNQENDLCEKPLGGPDRVEREESSDSSQGPPRSV